MIYRESRSACSIVSAVCRFVLGHYVLSVALPMQLHFAVCTEWQAVESGFKGLLTEHNVRTHGKLSLLIAAI